MRIPNQQGQTLIEVLIAIVVMFTGMLGVLALAQANINNERLGTDRLVATQLAREGIEMVRNVRDTNFMQGTTVPAPAVLDPWDKGIVLNEFEKGRVCGTLNGDTLTWSTACSNGVFSSEYQLKRTAAGLYSHTAGTATKFSRKLSTQPICLENGTEMVRETCDSSNERIGVEVRSEVGWTHFQKQNTTVLVAHLYNWR